MNSSTSINFNLPIKQRRIVALLLKKTENELFNENYCVLICFLYLEYRLKRMFLLRKIKENIFLILKKI